MLPISLKKNDRKAKQLIWVFSVVVFSAVALLGNFKLNFDPGFDVHVFAQANAFINSTIAILLLGALIAVKKKYYSIHKRMMITALVLSVIFLVFYIAHHLLTGEARFGDINHD